MTFTEKNFTPERFAAAQALIAKLEKEYDEAQAANDEKAKTEVIDKRRATVTAAESTKNPK